MEKTYAEKQRSMSINQMERLLNDGKLLVKQRQVMAEFDRFNELEAQCRISTRLLYQQALNKLGISLSKPFSEMTKEDLQEHISKLRQLFMPSVVNQHMINLKRFFRWLEWRRLNSEREERDKLDLRDGEVPYIVRWMRTEQVIEDISLEDLPSEEDILKIAESVDRQRDRALILLSWETGASPSEMLNLRVGDVLVNKYGAVIRFPRYTDSKTKTVNELKTKYRHRRVPVTTSVPDLVNWLSMHPLKNDQNAPLWWSKKGGGLGYSQFYYILKKAQQRAEVKHFNPYKLRHLRLSQVADVLPSHELKRFAGHSRNSTVTPRYLHTTEKRIERKIYAERGIEIEEEEKTETPLTAKICPRCKGKNSPTYRFCSQCGIPLDAETMFEVQKKAELLAKGNRYPIYDDGNPKYKELMDAFFEMQKQNPQLFSRLQKQFWETFAVELLRKQSATPRAKVP